MSPPISCLFGKKKMSFFHSFLMAFTFWSLFILVFAKIYQLPLSPCHRKRTRVKETAVTGWCCMGGVASFGILSNKYQTEKDSEQIKYHCTLPPWDVWKRVLNWQSFWENYSGRAPNYSCLSVSLLVKIMVRSAIGTPKPGMSAHLPTSLLRPSCAFAKTWLINDPFHGQP